MAQDNSTDSSEQVDALMVKVNHYAGLKAICTSTKSTFELEDLENRDRMARFEAQLVTAEAGLREALHKIISARR